MTFYSIFRSSYERVREEGKEGKKKGVEGIEK